MTLDEYIEHLRTEEPTSQCVNLDPGQEIRYMRAARRRFILISAAIPPAPSCQRVLDIGTTPFTLFLKRAQPHNDIWSIDRTDLMARRCKDGGVEFRVCDLERAPLPFDDELFDVVIFTEVLEHLFAPPSDILREIRRVIRPGGNLILSVPNMARLSHRVGLLLGHSPLPDADAQLKRDWVHGHGHIHEYTRNEITSLCRAAGFRLRRARMLSPRPWDAPARLQPTTILRFVYYSVVSLVPNWRSYVLIECTK